MLTRSGIVFWTLGLKDPGKCLQYVGKGSREQVFRGQKNPLQRFCTNEITTHKRGPHYDIHPAFVVLQDIHLAFVVLQFKSRDWRLFVQQLYRVGLWNGLRDFRFDGVR